MTTKVTMVTVEQLLDQINRRDPDLTVNITAFNKTLLY